MPFVRVPGPNRNHAVTLYALSTCGWCRKTKELLDSQGVEYQYVYVDQCSGDERETVSSQVRELNPRGSYPTIRIDDEVVTGFDQDRILELIRR